MIEIVQMVLLFAFCIASASILELGNLAKNTDEHIDKPAIVYIGHAGVVALSGFMLGLTIFIITHSIPCYILGGILGTFLGKKGCFRIAGRLLFRVVLKLDDEEIENIIDDKSEE